MRTAGWAVGIRFRLLLVLVIVIFAVPSAAHAELSMDNVEIEFVPGYPAPVEAELHNILYTTIHRVLGDELTSGELMESSAEYANAIMGGLNIILESKGYTVSGLEFITDGDEINVAIVVHSAGWTEDDSRSVEEVEISFDESIPQFWVQSYSERMEPEREAVYGTYTEFLKGLPLGTWDTSLTLDLVTDELDEADPLHEIFPSYDVTRTIELGSVTVVTIHMAPVDEVVELIRPRMYSLTLYNVILERLSERVVAEARFLEGIPKAEVEKEAEKVAERIGQAIEGDILARRLNANASVTVVVLPDEPVARIDCVVESETYDLQLETMVDFGNEARDSAEIQARFGLLFARGIEFFVNLNLFTNDSTLETDLAIGLRPTRRTFAAIGYDLDREATKYFFEQELATGLLLRGEIFEEDSLNEFGVTYHFQQYLSGGLFTNGNNEYWIRAIFEL